MTSTSLKIGSARLFVRCTMADSPPPRKRGRLLPTVHRLHLPEGPLVVGLECVPRMMMLNTAQDSFAARWMRCEGEGEDGERTEVGHTLIYTPTAADAAHKLRLEVTPVGPEGTTIAEHYTAVVSSVVVDDFSPRLVRRCAGTEVGGTRVLTYNVLSQRVATRDVFPYCPQWALRWPFRWRALRRELAAADADLACLQEVEADAWDAHFEPALRELGLAGVLALKRTRRGGLTHGCATLYRAAAWELVAHRTVTLADMLDGFVAAGEAGAAGVPAPLIEEARGKGTLVLLAALRARASEPGFRGLVLANSHLHWEAHRPQLKALQALLVIRAAAAFRAELGAPAAWPLVLAADLNSTPTIEHAGRELPSGVYALLRDGRLDSAHPHHPAHWTPPPSRGAPAEPATAAAPASAPACAPALQHGLALESAYASVLGREPFCTNFTGKFVGTIDYIWTERGGALSASAVLDVPDRAELAAHVALPSCVHPSDHLPLVATLSLASGADALDYAH